MPFVIFCVRSQERLQLPLQAFVHVYDSGSWIQNCKAVQMLLLLCLQELQGKGDGGWKSSVIASFPGWQEDCECVEKHVFAASSMSNNFLIVARRSLIAGFQKCLQAGTVNFRNSLSPPSIVMMGKKKHPRDLSDVRKKPRELTNLPKLLNSKTVMYSCGVICWLFTKRWEIRCLFLGVLWFIHSICLMLSVRILLATTQIAILIYTPHSIFKICFLLALHSIC